MNRMKQSGLQENNFAARGSRRRLATSCRTDCGCALSLLSYYDGSPTKLATCSPCEVAMVSCCPTHATSTSEALCRYTQEFSGDALAAVPGDWRGC